MKPQLCSNSVKYIRSLKLKKYRDRYRQFVIEGDKIIHDLISQKTIKILHLIATTEWLRNNPVSQSGLIKEITAVESREFDRISMLESPSGVMAIMDIPETSMDTIDASTGISLVLEDIQDPGNLGTIIRTASWFGIDQIYCSRECADCYNPKAVQASMGAVLNTRVFYTELPVILEKYAHHPDVTIYGTFMTGHSIWEGKLNSRAMIVFGNESKGISDELLPYIAVRLHIPSYKEVAVKRIESLNVASAAAIVCSAFRK